MQQHAARAQDQTPHDEQRHSVGPRKLVRLLDRINTWKAFLIVLALFLVFDGFLFYLLRLSPSSLLP
jgi:hypothetical protein